VCQEWQKTYMSSKSVTSIRLEDKKRIYHLETHLGQNKLQPETCLALRAVDTLQLLDRQDPATVSPIAVAICGVCMARRTLEE